MNTVLLQNIVTVVAGVPPRRGKVPWARRLRSIVTIDKDTSHGTDRRRRSSVFHMPVISSILRGDTVKRGLAREVESYDRIHIHS